MPKTSSTVATGAISKQALKGKSNQMPRGCIISFFLVFFLIGMGMFIPMFVLPAVEMLNARQWVATPCVIEASEVVEHSGDDGSTYSVKVRYRYRFQGQEYKSERYEINTISSSGRDGKEKVVAQYPPGKEATCYVNPQNPSTAVINRDFTPSMLFGLFPLLFIIVGLVGLLFFLRGKRAAPPHTTTAHSSIDSVGFERDAIEGAADEAELAEDEEFLPARLGGGQRVLKPEATPLVTFFVATAICLFWNGIVSIFLSIAVSSWLNGKGEWFLSIFLIPFVLIGFVLILVVIHSFLALFNPRPTITLMNGDLAIGESTELRWQFTGSTRSLRQVKIHLEGSEKATYQRGTTTQTDTKTFAKIVVVDTNQPHEMMAGSRTLEIPRRTMHSLEAGRNRIVWSLRIEGDIAFWPNVNATFPIPIFPSRRDG